MKLIKYIPLLLLFVCQIGCGSKYPADWPKTYPCTITVTKDGKPYEGVTLVLARTENHGSWAVAGLTNSSGVAEIETSWTKASVKGAPEGTFKITASAAAPPPERSISDAELEAMPYDKRTAFLEAEAAKARNSAAIPVSLADPSRTKALIEVKPDTPATLTIEINDYR
jgi:hypothetical protein